MTTDRPSGPPPFLRTPEERRHYYASPEYRERPSLDPDFGPRMRGLREAAGLTTREAAALLGINRKTLVRIERGTNPCGVVLCRRMGDAYDLLVRAKAGDEG